MVYEKRKTRVGRVISDKMSKTVIVAVEWKQPHPKYGKPVRRTTKLVAHDIADDCRIGDLVKIVETRPLSKTKRWRVLEIISNQRTAGITTMETDTSAEDEKPAEDEKLESMNEISEEKTAESNPSGDDSEEEPQ